MIVFDVTCGNSHTFEGWFQDSASFEKQAAAGLVACPICGDSHVRKGLAAPRLGGLGKGKETKAPRKTKGKDVAVAPPQAKLVEYLAAVHELKSHVERNSDYVGEKFPEEARKIHYGEAEPRSIYGEASPGEARELKDEGVEFHRIPWPRKLDS